MTVSDLGLKFLVPGASRGLLEAAGVALTSQVPTIHRALGALVPYIVGTWEVRVGLEKDARFRVQNELRAARLERLLRTKHGFLFS